MKELKLSYDDDDDDDPHLLLNERRRLLDRFEEKYRIAKERSQTCGGPVRVIDDIMITSEHNSSSRVERL